MTRLEAAYELIRLVDAELTYEAAGRDVPAYMSRDATTTSPAPTSRSHARLSRRRLECAPTPREVTVPTSTDLLIAAGACAVLAIALYASILIGMRRRRMAAVTVLRDRSRSTQTPTVTPTAAPGAVDVDAAPATPAIPPRDDQGATAEWSPLAEIASIGEGRLLAAGTPEVSVDDLDEADLIAAQTAAEFAALDDRLEAARRAVNSIMIEMFGAEIVPILNELTARDIAAQTWAEQRSTGPIPITTAPRRATQTPAQRRRQRHRTNRMLGAGVGQVAA